MNDSVAHVANPYASAWATYTAPAAAPCGAGVASTAAAAGRLLDLLPQLLTLMQHQHKQQQQHQEQHGYQLEHEQRQWQQQGQQNLGQPQCDWAPAPGPPAKRSRQQTDRHGFSTAASEGGGVTTCPLSQHAQQEWEAQLKDLGAAEHSSSLTEAGLKALLLEVEQLQCGSAGVQQQQMALGALVAALLQGPRQSLLGELYLPWLVSASPQRVARECSTFVCYLELLRAGMEWHAVHRLCLGYLQGMLTRILRVAPRCQQQSAAAGAAGAMHAGQQQQQADCQPSTPAASLLAQCTGMATAQDRKRRWASIDRDPHGSGRLSGGGSGSGTAAGPGSSSSGRSSGDRRHSPLD